MDEMWSFYHDKRHQIWLWWAIDHLLELLKPLNLGKVYTDGNYAYYERFSPNVLTVTKKNTQKIERKHLSLRTWSAWLVRKGLRFSKTEEMHKIVVALTINIRFFGRLCLLQ
jgi:insertion element IS1 protein InsB